MARQARHVISIVSGSLTAILDKQPGKRRRDLLLVVVDVEIDAALTIELVPAVPQGINPLIKLLRFRLDAPKEGNGAAIVRRTLRYEETPADADYREVWLGQGDTAVSTKVSIVI